MSRKFKRPRNDIFRHYCYQCKYWTFVKDIGCAHVGRCDAIEDRPSEQDAYDALCGLFELKKGYKA